MLTLSGPEFACGKDRVLRGPLLLLLLTAPPCELSAISNARPGQPTIMELQARRFAFPLLFQVSLAFNWIAMMNLPRPTSLLSSTRGLRISPLAFTQTSIRLIVYRFSVFTDTLSSLKGKRNLTDSHSFKFI